MKLYKQHPNLVLKLQDLPERISQAQNEIWPTRCPEAIVDERIEFRAFDMIHEPPIPNCDIYFVSPHLVYSSHLTHQRPQLKNIMWVILVAFSASGA